MMPDAVRAVLLATLLCPLAATAQSGGVAAIQCETLATPESGLVDLVAIGPGGAIAWTDGPRATAIQLWKPQQQGRTVSRNGAGPGELRLVSAMGWRADTLWVTDARLNRVTGFAAGHTFLRTIPLPSRGNVVARDDSSFIGSITAAPQPGAMSLGDGPLVVGVVTPASGRIVNLLSVAAVPHPDPKVLPTLKPVSAIASNRDASRWCAMANGAVGGTQLACVTSTGRVLFETSLLLPERAVPETVLDDEVATFARQMGVPASAVTDQFSRPRSSSAAFTLMVNGTTDVWVGRSKPADTEAIWERVGFDGKLLTRRVFPGRYQVRAVDGNVFYAAETDLDGVQTLVRCRLAP